MTDYETWTVDRYERSVGRLFRLRKWYVLFIVGGMLLGYVLLLHHIVPQRPAGRVLQYFTVVWLLPAPALIVAAFVYLVWLQPELFALELPKAGRDVRDPTVVWMVTSRGTEPRTVAHTVDSVLYWTRRHPELCYSSLVWVQIEAPGYLQHREQFDRLRAKGVEIHVTPTAYSTKHGTVRKGRALQYATELRRRRFADLKDVWVYHQDEETAVSEDAVVGIDQFLVRHSQETAVGVQLIIYDQYFSERPSQVAEFSRTDYDVRKLFTMTRESNVMGGFHGSAFIVRADVEDRAEWDEGKGVLTEDLIFELRMRRLHGVRFYIVPGFAHEQAPFNIRDQFKQRRRWVQGINQTYWNYPFGVARRAVLSYSMFAWYTASICVPMMFLGFLVGFGSLVATFGLLAGFIWAMMITHFHRGYVLHKEYLPPNICKTKLVLAGILGSMVDGASPWYALFSRRREEFEVIQKDRF